MFYHLKKKSIPTYFKDGNACVKIYTFVTRFSTPPLSSLFLPRISVCFVYKERKPELEQMRKLANLCKDWPTMFLGWQKLLYVLCLAVCPSLRHIQVYSSVTNELLIFIYQYKHTIVYILQRWKFTYVM